MNYFFILGQQPALSLAELETRINGQWQVINDQLAVVKTTAELPSNLLFSLGGTIKFGQVFGRLLEPMVKIISQYLLDQVDSEQRIYFGLSNYAANKLDKRLGIAIKRELQNQGRSVRWVTSQEQVLSSVVVEQNKLTSSQGSELVVWQDQGQWCWGRTIAAQPFKELSARDYGRPARDDQSGMLPPKLAQIMINLAQLQPGDSLLDPFCGSGTVLQEAALMGASRVIGLDNSVVAINNSQANWQWLTDRWSIKAQAEIKLADAGQASQQKLGVVNLIVTEPYLGPQRGQRDFLMISQELAQLYSQALQDWQKVIAPGGRVVMVWPVFVTKKQTIAVQPIIKGWRIVNYSQLAKKTWPQHYTKAGHLLYGRPGQTVHRTIVGLEKIID